jgi:hypothetical protein
MENKKLETERVKTELKMWGEEDKKSPSSMVRRLAALKSESNNKIKVLDFREPVKRLIKMSLGWELSKSSRVSKVNTPIS